MHTPICATCSWHGEPGSFSNPGPHSSDFEDPGTSRLHRRHQRAPAAPLVSGGTTGLPKLIPRTHDDYVYNAVASAQACEMVQ